jgi:hypothetical protein
MMSMQLGDGSKPRKIMRKSGMKEKMMLLKRKPSEKNYIKLRKFVVWRPNFSKD